jgi:predicted P-loop ATPase
LDEDGGQGKSRFVSLLGPDPSYSYEGDPNIGNSLNMALTLTGCWFVDFSEGDAFDKKSKETRKRQITTTRDRVVKKFENLNSTIERPYVFLCTTNNPYPIDSLDFATVRRHQIIKVKKFDAKEWLRIREQVWFEANRELELARANMKPGDKDPYVVMDEDIKELTEYSRQFVMPSALREQITSYFTDNDDVQNFYTVDEMQNLCKTWNKFATAQQIKSVMCDDLGFIKAKKDYEIVIDGNPIIQRGRWVYIHPNHMVKPGVLRKGSV